MKRRSLFKMLFVAPLLALFKPKEAALGVGSGNTITGSTFVGGGNSHIILIPKEFYRA